MGIVSTNRKFFEELSSSCSSSTTGLLKTKNKEQWQWTQRMQHREDNNIPTTNTNDEMIQEEENEEEMTNDEMIDSLISLLNYWSYSNTQNCTNDQEDIITTMIPLQKYDVRDEDEEVTIYNEMIDALLLYLEEPIPSIISSSSRISEGEDHYDGSRKQKGCCFTSPSPCCHQKAVISSGSRHRTHYSSIVFPGAQAA